MFVRLLELALLQLDSRNSLDVEQDGSGSSHPDDESLRQRIRVLLGKEAPPSAGLPDVELLTLWANATAAIVELFGIHNVASAVSGNMPGYCRLPPVDLRRALESIQSLERLWQEKGRRR